jgi:serine/threonine protein phosphatase PrpC
MSESNHWRVVSASVSGTSHQNRGQPCQDAYHWEILPEGVLVAAVADGAGSAALGEVGATVATQTAVETIRTHKDKLRSLKNDTDWQLLLTDAIKAARIAVEAEATARQVKLRDLASTLILVVATPELVAAVQIGDGAAVLGDRQGNIIALTAPQSGEYINETTFLTSPNPVEKAQMTVRKAATAQVAVFSDGLQMLALKMPECTPHTPFFAPLFRFVEGTIDQTEAKAQLEEFLRSSRVTQRTDDDLTLLLAISQ